MKRAYYWNWKVKERNHIDLPRSIYVQIPLIMKFSLAYNLLALLSIFNEVAANHVDVNAEDLATKTGTRKLVKVAKVAEGDMNVDAEARKLGAKKVRKLAKAAKVAEGDMDVDAEARKLGANKARKLAKA